MRRKRANIVLGIVFVVGLCFAAAGVSLPHEETIAFGMFLMLAAGSVLLGLNFPVQRKSALYSLDKYRIRRPAKP